MEGLLSFMLFAVLFYFIVRIGCGAHRVRGTVKFIDPVSGRYSGLVLICYVEERGRMLLFSLAT